MKKQLSWQVLVGGAVLSYFLKYILGGVIGDALGLLGLILLLMGIIAGVRVARQKKNSNQ